MESIYLCIVAFLLCLAVFDLFVGVSNDAVNFLQSAVGSRVAKFRTILIVASAGVILGAVMSSGMMDVARHGIMMPAMYSFREVMTIFLAVMVTDVIVLDAFNSLGMPTSTTVSLVFELLGGTLMLAMLKVMADGSLDYGSLLNSDKALQVIIAIFVSVAISFVVGVVVMWVSRMVFTFNYSRHSRYTIAIFGGIAFTALAYFIFIKGIGGSPYIPEAARQYIDANTNALLLATFVGSTILMELLHLLRVNIFKLVVLMGTFSLAMAFAGNDLVNFIGVPLAGLDSWRDFMANGHGATPDTFMMSSLMESASTPPPFLFAAGIIMIIAMATSKKAKNVIKTSVGLSRQDEGDEMFGSSRAARAIVRFTQSASDCVSRVCPRPLKVWVNSRFNSKEVELADDNRAAFDLVRAAVNLVVASLLITFGTNHKLPLSTTYVTFMVAMGTSLADRAWSRESAVFRVTGVMSVIGGWFITAGVSFLACAIVCLCMWYGGMPVQAAFIVLVVAVLIHSSRKAKKDEKAKKDDDRFALMMRTRDPELVWEMLRSHVSDTQATVCRYALDEYNAILNAFCNEDAKTLRGCDKSLRAELVVLKKLRRREMLGLKRSPMEIAIERNTWFHVGANSDQQFVYTLRRMLMPIKEHIDNNFNPVPKEYIEEYEPVRQKVEELMNATIAEIEAGDYSNYRDVLADADTCKDRLSALRKNHLNRMQTSHNSTTMQVDMVYLNLLQETQQFLSVMRHQLRSAKKFME